MFDEHVIAVVIAAFQEQKLIGGVISTIPSFVDHIVIVDDASTDSTCASVLAVADPRVVLLRHEHNQGVGAARATGHQAALALGAEICVVMDGDGQMDPAFLPDLLRPVIHSGYGFSKANRFFSATSYAGMPRRRVFGNIALTFLTKAASGYWTLVDPQNGFTAIRADVLRRLDLTALASGYAYENDMLIWLNILEVPAVDVPVPARYGNETSSLRPGRDGLKIARALHRGFWRRIWRRYVLWSFSPVALLLFSGMALLAFALAAGAVALSMTDAHRALPAASVLLSVAPGLMGFHLLLQALMLDIQGVPQPSAHLSPKA